MPSGQTNCAADGIRVGWADGDGVFLVVGCGDSEDVWSAVVVGFNVGLLIGLVVELLDINQSGPPDTVDVDDDGVS